MQVTWRSVYDDSPCQKLRSCSRRGRPLARGSKNRVTRKDYVGSRGSNNSILSTSHQAKAYVLSDSVTCTGANALSKVTTTFLEQVENLQQGGSNSSRGINAKVLDSEFNVSGFTSVLLLATMKQQVSFTRRRSSGVDSGDVPQPHSSSSWE